MKDLYKLARLAVESPDLLVEVLGVLSNIGASELPRTVTFPDLIKENGKICCDVTALSG